MGFTSISNFKLILFRWDFFFLRKSPAPYLFSAFKPSFNSRFT